MLVLTLADYRATATMGPVLAVGTAITVLAGLTLLPALLAILGRARRSGRPRRAPAARRGRRSGASCGRGRGATIPPSARCSSLGALGALEDRPPLSFADSFREPPESVRRRS